MPHKLEPVLRSFNCIGGTSLFSPIFLWALLFVRRTVTRGWHDHTLLYVFRRRQFALNADCTKCGSAPSVDPTSVDLTSVDPTSADPTEQLSKILLKNNAR